MPYAEDVASSSPRPEPTVSGAAARYLKAAWYLSSVSESVTVGRLAIRVGVSHATTSVAVKQLIEDEFLDRGPGGEVYLTELGEAEAVRLVRRHRLVETFLARVLSYSWHEVHDEAEALEWVMNDALVDRIARLLGEPDRNPHGNPIPNTEGRLPVFDDVALLDLDDGEKARIMSVSEAGPSVLQYLDTTGLGIGTVVRRERREPLDGPLVIGSSRGEHFLGLTVAESIFVSRINDTEPKEKEE